ncbi:hypothetical protein FLP10_11635 [Agromyces intestinalis]|uniref:DUF1963 domain-containing protein n=1 Tax=Agromyces intestinalis TaxID=2592652 RepID=A0A5C1YFV4_9MICO|nr:hypothetical protein [Agromyces intestinalis]QEO14994.1 hypothetical protein FLP10_11635 [Agromyces intestinalis]
MRIEDGTGGASRNERLTLTDAERGVAERIGARGLAAPAPSEADLRVERSRRELNRLTRDAFTELIPGLSDRAREHSEAFETAFDEVKGLGGVIDPARGFDLDDLVAFPAPPHLVTFDDLDLIGGAHVGALTQPAGAGELWWAETSWGVTAPANSLFVDIDSGDRSRIWGHIRYAGDDLMTGSVGIAMTFILSPDRYPRMPKRTFEVRPELRTGGWLSGWTDQYHPIWHADDKWSKLWRRFEANLTLSSGESLAASALHDSLIFLENANPVGQANVNEFLGWGPILRFDADFADLRRRGVSMILTTLLRFDFQLEGGADLWWRHRPGSQNESVAAFDNALEYRCWPGSVVPA